MSTEPSDEELQTLREELIAEGRLTGLVEQLDSWRANDQLASTNVTLNPRQLQAWADFAIALSETYKGVTVKDGYGVTLIATKPLKEREATAVRMEWARLQEEK
jgi:hypothetical protein